MGCTGITLHQGSGKQRDWGGGRLNGQNDERQTASLYRPIFFTALPLICLSFYTAYLSPNSVYLPMFLPFSFPVHSFFIDQTHFSTKFLCALNINVAQMFLKALDAFALPRFEALKYKFKKCWHTRTLFFFFFPPKVSVYMWSISAFNPHCEGGKRADIGNEGGSISFRWTANLCA